MQSLKFALPAVVAAWIVASPANAQSRSQSFLRKVASWHPGKYLERSLMFHPSSDEQWWKPLPDGIEVYDVWLNGKNGQRIHAWWFPVANTKGAVLFCHGNAGNLNQWSPRVVRVQKALRRSVLIFDYPGYGKSGGEPDEEGCHASAEAAHAWLVNQARVPAQEIILFGESLGGGMATRLASKHPHRALVLVRTFTSMPAIVKQCVWTSAAAPLIRNTFDNLGTIQQCKGPIFIAHGDRDNLIHFPQARKLFLAAPEPKQFHLLEGLGHNDPYPTELLTGMARFINLHASATDAAPTR